MEGSFETMVIQSVVQDNCKTGVPDCFETQLFSTGVEGSVEALAFQSAVEGSFETGVTIWCGALRLVFHRGFDAKWGQLILFSNGNFSSQLIFIDSM